MKKDTFIAIIIIIQINARGTLGKDLRVLVLLHILWAERWAGAGKGLQ